MILKRIRSSRRKTILMVVLTIVVLWVLSVMIPGVSLLLRAWRFQQLAANPSSLTLTLVTQEVHSARGELETLRVTLAPLLWIGGRVGGDWGAAEPLMDAAVESVIAGDECLSALNPLLPDFSMASVSVASVPRVVDALVIARPAFAKSAVHMDIAVAKLATVRGPFSPQVERLLVQASKLTGLGQQGVVAAQFVPDLMGRERPQTYLVLVQNSDELRPTGGFITTVGRIVVDHGKIVTQTFEDTYTIDDFTKYYPDPPAPLLDYMSSEQWVFRDANWSPDFPTSARDAITLYQIGRPGQVDGVIAINLKTVQMLMAGLEPLKVEGFAEPITAGNAIDLLRRSRDPVLDSRGKQSEVNAWAATHKQGIGVAMRAAMDKLLSGKANWGRLAQGVSDALRQRQIFFYVPIVQDQLKRLSWDGSVRIEEGDYLMVVDANLGFTRANVLISQAVDYRVALNLEGSGHAMALVNYTHQGRQTGIECKPTPPLEMVTYDTLVNRCYYDYLRLYVPEGSKLRNTTKQSVPGKYLVSGRASEGKVETLSENIKRSVFGQFFVVEYGKELQTRFEYDLPIVVRDVNGNQEYVLTLQKQSGTDALPVKMAVTLPSQARFISAKPSPASQSGNVLGFELRLDTDEQISVTYSLGQ